jgi:hypothetical protein
MTRGYAVLNLIGFLMMIVAFVALAGALIVLEYETYGSPWSSTNIYQAHRNIEAVRLGDDPIGTMDSVDFVVYDHPVIFYTGPELQSPPTMTIVDVPSVNMRVRQQQR